MHGIRTAVFAMGLGILAAGVACAQQPLVPRVSPMLRQVVISRMTLNVVAGRIVNNANWQFGGGSSTSTDGTNKEQITFRGNGATGSLSYSRTTAEEELSMEINSEGRFLLRQSKKAKAGGAGASLVELLQVAGEPISLTVTVKDRQEVYRAPTLWHLLIVHPEECRQQLAPLLEPLRPQWQFIQTATAIETNLLKLAAGNTHSDRKVWAEWVTQLGDARYTKREAADRQLREAGPVVLSYLEKLDFNQLDAEQQFRVRRIVRSMSRQANDDAPEQVAASLADDPSVWLALLGRSDVATRRTAAQQLTTLLGHSIEIDPAADPASQQKARDELRKTIEAQQEKNSPRKPEVKK